MSNVQVTRVVKAIDDMTGRGCECFVVGDKDGEFYDGIFRGIDRGFVVLEARSRLIFFPAAVTAIHFGMPLESAAESP